jgi:hypothetical protein
MSVLGARQLACIRMFGVAAMFTDDVFSSMIITSVEDR